MSSPNTAAVELAYPLQFDGHDYKPDEVVELPAEKADQLVHDGYARWAADPQPSRPEPSEASTATPVAARGE